MSTSGSVRRPDPMEAARAAVGRLHGAVSAEAGRREAERLELVELAVNDVIRTLVLARRWARDLLSELVELDDQGSELITEAVLVLVVSRLTGAPANGGDARRADGSR